MPAAIPHYLPSRAAASRALRGSVLVMALAGATLAGLALRDSAGIAAVWPCNGIILALMLVADGEARHATRLTVLAGGLGIVTVAELAGGIEPGTLAGYTVSNALEILAAFALLRARVGTRASLTRPGHLMLFATLGAGVAPFVSGLCVIFVFGLYRPALFPIWFAGHALGLALATPLTLVAQRGWLRPFRGRRIEAALQLALVLVTAGLGFWQSAVPLLFLPFPPMVLATMRFGAPAAAWTLPLVFLVALLSEADHLGPIASDAIGPVTGLATLQLYIATLVVTMLPLGAVVSQSRRRARVLARRAAAVRRIEARMRDGEALYRLLADNSSDIISRFSLDGVRLYVSPSVTEILGWSAAEMLASDYKRYVHPDDLAGFAAVGAKMREGAERLSNTYRYLKRDGSWAWLEARLILARDADGTPREYISNTRDITRQKEAEMALAAAAAELTELAATDALTGVANRRRFDEMLDREWRRAMRSQEQLSLLLIDVDLFKRFNDRYGHLMGDTCLHAIATAIAARVRRPGDLVARYGGEEFAVILPSTDGAGAMEIAARVHEGIAALAMPHADNPGGCITVSIGCAEAFPNRSTDSSVLVAAADTALYEAKRLGRNRSERGPILEVPEKIVRLQIPRR